MRSETGHTLMELMIVIAITTMIASLGMVSFVDFIASGRLSSATWQLADDLVTSRTVALARYEQRRITFDLSGGSVARSYILESCKLDAGPPLSPCTNGWVIEGQRTISGSAGFSPTRAGAPLSQLVIDRTGLPVGGEVDVLICATEAGTDGVVSCVSGAVGRLVRIKAYTGAVEY